MHRDGARPLLETRTGLGRELDRSVIHRGDGILEHRRGLEQAGFRRLDVVGMKAKEGDPVLRHERESRPEVGQLGITHANQMRHPHRVEDARVCRLRRRQVGIAVEVDQTEVWLVTQQSGDDPEGHGAIAAEDERDQLALNRPSDDVSNLARDLDHPGLALSFAIVAVGRKAGDRQIAEVVDLQAGFAERAEQPRLTERGGRLLLAGAVGAGARGNTDQAELHRPSPYPTSTRTRTCEPSRTIRRSPSGVVAPHIPHRSTTWSWTAVASSAGSMKRTRPSID